MCPHVPLFVYLVYWQPCATLNSLLRPIFPPPNIIRRWKYKHLVSVLAFI